ncbi:MAG: glutamate 5-kinase [Rickettsiales bacterium]
MLRSAKRIVIKIGSSLISGGDGRFYKKHLKTIAADISELKKQKKEIIIVSSGAVALGRQIMGYGMKKLTLEEKQAAAACGNILLMEKWQSVLKDEGTKTLSFPLYPAQILFTADDSINRRRYLNARGAIDTMIKNQQVIPIINENDTVATAELRFGDNDRLAARVTQMASADLLILLSDVDGLYNSNPRTNSKAKLIDKIIDITPEIEAMAGGSGSQTGTGGMITKIEAAKIATNAGCHTIISSGTVSNPIKKLIDGGLHTIFIAKETPLSARKHWIAGSLHPAGKIIIDDGAEKAVKSGKSLLPAGVAKISGNFDRGDTIMIYNKNNKKLGCGLIAYNSEDTTKIIGKKSSEIEKILGFRRKDVLIHRDDMVLESRK